MIDLDNSIVKDFDFSDLDDLVPELTPDEILSFGDTPTELTFPELHWGNKPLERSVDLIQFDGTISKQEMDFVRDFLQTKITMNLEDALPSSMDDTTLVSSLTAFSKVYSAVNKASDILQPIVGRLMVLMESRPDIIKQFGVTNMSQFATEVAPKMFRVARCDAFDAKRIAKLVPNLTPDEYATIGRSNIKTIGKLADWNKDSPVVSKYMQVVANNPNMKHNDLLERMASDGHDISHLKMTRIDLRVTQSERAAWKEFVEDSDVQAHVGSKNEVVIFFAMMAEFYETAKAISAQKRTKEFVDQNGPKS